MGILNVTPDSFSDGGLHSDLQSACAHARRLVAEGADIIDIGGESTRPGANTVPADEEIRRVVPVIAALRELGIPLSVDTRKTEVMLAAIEAGVDMVNDIAALEAPGALGAVAGSTVALCLMHKQGEPQSMQHSPQYASALGDVLSYLATRQQRAIQAGISPERIILDPGFGFGKAFEHNVDLFRHLQAFQSLSSPILVGVSRKSMLGQILGGASADERDIASVVAALLAVQKGAAIVRVHAVRPTVDALQVIKHLN